jgi:hypothetical protein
MNLSWRVFYVHFISSSYLPLLSSKNLFSLPASHLFSALLTGFTAALCVYTTSVEDRWHRNLFAEYCDYYIRGCEVTKTIIVFLQTKTSEESQLSLKCVVVLSRRDGGRNIITVITYNTVMHFCAKILH